MEEKKQRKLSRKQKNLLGLGIIAVVIIGIVIVWLMNGSTTTLKQNFHIPNADQITKIIVKDRNNQMLTLAKTADSSWTVNGKYEANMTLVSSVVNTFKDMRIREPLTKAARNNVVKDLATGGKIVEVYTTEYGVDFWFVHLFKKERLKATYYVGHETADEMGTFMLKKGENDPYVVYIPNFRGYIATRFNTTEDMWRTHTVFNYKQSEIDNIKVEVPDNPRENFSLVNNSKGFTFLNADGQTVNDFDTTKVVAFLSSFVEMNYERIEKNVSKIEKDTIFSKKPTFIITVKDKKGKESSLRTFVKLNDPTSIAKDEKDFYRIFDINRCYAISSHIKDTLVMQFFVLDNVLKPASYYMKGAEGLPYVK